MGQVLLNIGRLWFIYAILMVFIAPSGNGWAEDFGFYVGSSARFVLSLGGLLF